MTAPTATIVGPAYYPPAAAARPIASRSLRYRCVGPDGVTLRDSDGALAGESTLFTSQLGAFSLTLPLNSDIDEQSGVGGSGTYWLFTLGNGPSATTWACRLDAADSGATIAFADGAHTVVDPTPRGWVPVIGSSAALTPGPLANRPVSANPGQTYFATDTGDTYTWTGTVWMLTAQATPSLLLSQVAYTGTSANLVLANAATDNFPEMTAATFTMPTGSVQVVASNIGLMGSWSAVEWVTVASSDGGSTWTPIAAAAAIATIGGLGHAIGSMVGQLVSGVSFPAGSTIAVALGAANYSGSSQTVSIVGNAGAGAAVLSAARL